MANVTLPTPVFIAGGALCLVAGYLIGTVAGPDTPHRTTATVVSFDSKTSRLCLNGGSVKNEKNADENGMLCGTWSHSTDASKPHQGDNFRFVAMDTSGVKGSEPRSATIIYGTVER
ncbi:MAG: hypothetical protein ACJ72D_19385 [Marmoricola sp.]